MVDGTYEITMKTPMGKKRGMLILHEMGNAISGMLDILGSVHPFENGLVSGEHFSFSGVLKTALLMIPHSTEGDVDGDVLTATVKTTSGDMKISGHRLRSAERAL